MGEKKPRKFPNVSIYWDGVGWRVSYRVPGEKRRYPRKRELAVAEKLAAKMSGLIEQVKAGLIDPKQLRHQEHGNILLVDHLKAWRQSLRGAKVTEKQVKLQYSRVRMLLSASRATMVSHLTDSRIKQGLEKLARKMKRRPEGRSLSTLSHFVQAIKQFCRWLDDDERVAVAPLRSLRGYNAKKDPRHVRRTLALSDLSRLMCTTERAPTYRTRLKATMSGKDRRICYEVAWQTGYRADELRHLTHESFRLSGTSPSIVLSAKWTKNGEDAEQFITPELAARLLEWLNGRPAGKPVFDLPEKTAAMLRKDLKLAAIPYRAADGLVFDFHSLRLQCGQDLVDAGVDLRTVQRVMRHSTITLTMETYGKKGLRLTEDASAASRKRPTLPAAPQQEAQKATGTYGKVADGGEQIAQHFPCGTLRPNATIGPSRVAAAAPENNAGAGIKAVSGIAAGRIRTCDRRIRNPLPNSPQPIEEADLADDRIASHRKSRSALPASVRLGDFAATIRKAYADMVRRERKGGRRC